MHTPHPTGLVDSLRRQMARLGLDALVVPTSDPHGSEYLPARYQTRQYLTGFTGSAGTAVVTARDAALWTDSRYFLQAAAQLEGTPFRLMRQGLDAGIGAWLAARLGSGSHTVGFTAETFGRADARALGADLPEGYRLVPLEADPFDSLWPDRPALPAAPVYAARTQPGSRTWAQRRQAVMAGLEARTGLRSLLVDDLSEIAWLTGLRGSDVDYNPVFLAYLHLSDEHGDTLFTDAARLTPEALRRVRESGLRLAPYADAFRLAARCAPGSLALSQSVNMRLAETAARAGHTHFVASPVPPVRASKDAGEIEGFRQAMLSDGAALVRFLSRLSDPRERRGWTELSVDQELTALRRREDGFISLSFPTIAGYGPHGAIVHYEATPASAAPLEPRGLLLIDSGGHYASGTTDITRTLALGPVSEEERRVYTLVLKGHIALERMHFPEGTTGLQLDTAARAAMWREGYDFGHGTGHGVGASLPVHEGPLQIRKDVRPDTLLPLAAGQVVTDEPGIYVEGRFGVRIENVLHCVPAGETPFGRFLRFEPLTLCPIDLEPVEPGLLTAGEIAWLDAYHARCRRELMPRLDGPADAAARRWLLQATRPLLEAAGSRKKP